jgi:hypothetical protein
MSVEAPVTLVSPEKGYANDDEIEKKMGSDSGEAGPEKIGQEQEVLGVLDLDPALNKKMHIVNNVSPCLIL